jgi:hypothetical protein
MLVSSFVKDPAAILDYYLDWTAWLADDTLTDSMWVATGSASVTLMDPGVLGTVTRVWVDGGVNGELVDLTNHVVTAQGREDERTLRLILRD